MPPDFGALAHAVELQFTRLAPCCGLPGGIVERNRHVGTSSVRAGRCRHGIASPLSQVGHLTFVSRQACDIPRRPPRLITAPLTNACTSAITLSGSFSNDTQSVFFDRSANLTAIIDRFDEVDTFVGPTGRTLVGDPYHSITEVRFDSSGDVTSVYSLAVLEKVTLPDGTTALFAGRLNLLTVPPGTFNFIPDTGHSSDLAGFCAALDAGQALS
jgi:hypothetical protein